MTAQPNKLSVYFVAMATLYLCATSFGRPSAGAEFPTVQVVEPTGHQSGDQILSPRGRLQGPALDEPKELFAMLEQRKEFLAKKEDRLRLSEERLTALKKEVEQSLTRFEQSVKAADGNRKAVREKLARAEADEQRNAQAHLIKMYESMPAEDAAVRIEKMPESKALDLLRLLKGKTAGAILASVKPAQAAKLTERLIGSQSKQKK
jgi:flagellar motility protein MotE (MotC chaperone)